MQASPNRRSALGLLETILALLVAFVAATVLGIVAVLLTATLIEEDGPATLVHASARMTVDLTPLDTGDPPTPDATRQAVREALPEADVSVRSTDDGEWVLTVWFVGDVPDGGPGRVLGALQSLGWSHDSPSFSEMPLLTSLQEAPRMLRRYLPAFLTSQALSFVTVAILMLLWRSPAPVGRGRTTAAAVAGWGIGGAALAFLGSTAIAGVFTLLGVEVAEQEWILTLVSEGGGLLALAPWMVLVGPVAEEVFFRGYVFRRLLAASGPGLAYGTSAVLFGAIHFHPVGFPAYTVIGLAFCWVYRRAGTLWAPVVAHVVYNGLVMVLLMTFDA